MTDEAAQDIKAHCPDCNRETNCQIHGAVDRPWTHDDGEHHVNGQIDHKLLECRGCNAVFYHRSSWDSEDWDNDYDPRTQQDIVFYPRRVEPYPAQPTTDRRPDWTTNLHKTDFPLSDIMGEMYRAADNQSYILASVGLRTALDRAMEILGIDPGHHLTDKLKSLKDKGFIGPSEHDTLTVVAEAGNAAAHQAWSPGRGEFAHLLVVLEQFIHRNIIVGQKALDVKNNIPAKQTRPKKAKNAESLEFISTDIPMFGKSIESKTG